MKTKSTLNLLLTAAAIVIITAGATQAEIVRTVDSFGSGVNAFNIDFVTIGHAGNAADNRDHVYSRPNGAVGYGYRIGTYEITNAQWDAFCAIAGTPTGQPASAYDAGSQSTAPNEATEKVSWYEAAQFVNWLNTSTGHEAAYVFDANGNFCLQPGGGYRNANAFYFLPSNDEWYKAAYYDLDGDTYYDYANGTNTKPSNDENGSNYKDGSYATIGGVPVSYPYVWDVGTGAMEQNGTWDMMGNVEEWLETARDKTNDVTDEWRGRRGGSNSVGDNDLSVRWLSGKDDPDREDRTIGFRIAAQVPEPSSIAMLFAGLGAIGIFAGLRRKD